MAEKTPQFTIKVGADSVDYFSREVTKSDVTAGVFEEDDIGLIKIEDSLGLDTFTYPQLVRRTGDSLKGTTESIESNELRKGRTKSAPRKGSSSAEGSLDYEFSPETYDDIMEAALRGRWTAWTSDTDSASNLTDTDGTKDSFEDGYFLSKTTDTSTGTITEVHKRLYADSDEAAEIYSTIQSEDSSLSDTEIKSDPRYPIVVTDAKVEVAELNCGSADIRYSVLKHFDGVENDDLYQEFQHMAVDTMSLSISPNQIITGSFGFMGSNNPDIVQKGIDSDGNIEYADDDETTPKGLVKELAEWGTHETRFAPATDKTWDVSDVQEWIEGLPEKGTSTDQFTAREGFLYINGMRVRYGSSLEFNLSNGLERTFAIFEKDSIAISPLTLDITGTLGAYLIKGYTENLYNLVTQDEDVEVLFCMQDQEDDPENLYVVQIFKTKFTDADLSSGAEILEVSFPFQSFEERAVRIFRIRKISIASIAIDSSYAVITVTLSSADASATVDDFTVTVGGTEVAVSSLETNDNTTFTLALETSVAATVYGQTVKVTYNDETSTLTNVNALTLGISSYSSSTDDDSTIDTINLTFYDGDDNQTTPDISITESLFTFALLTTDSGSAAAVDVSSVTDNEDGTVTVTLDSAVASLSGTILFNGNTLDVEYPESEESTDEE